MGSLASKKNVMLLAAILLFVILSLASYQIKQVRTAQESLLGGQVEVLHEGGTLPNDQDRFMRDHALRLAYVADMKLSLTLPKGPMVSQVRGFDTGYPLRGMMKINRMGNRNVFIADPKTQLYGVAVSQPFLKQSGMRIGDRFAMYGRNYELRGIVEALPDVSGQALLDAPLVLMESRAEVGNGMWFATNDHRLRYFLVMKTLSPWEFKQQFTDRFRDSKAVITKASDVKK